MPQIIARNLPGQNQADGDRQKPQDPSHRMGESSNEGPRFAKPFYTAESHTPQKSDSCSKIRTNRVARTLLSAAFELVGTNYRNASPRNKCQASR